MEKGNKKKAYEERLRIALQLKQANNVYDIKEK